MNKINKSIILLATAVSFYTPISFANSEKFYVKANAGLFKLNNVKLKSKHDETTAKFQSTRENRFFGVGVGYNLTDKFRADLMLDYFMNVKNNSWLLDTQGWMTTSKFNGDISTLTINGYFDFLQLDNIKLFAGAGLGTSQIKGTFKAKIVVHGSDPRRDTRRAKTSNNFTYALHLGASAKVADNLHTDLTYSWRDFGKIKTKDRCGHPFGLAHKGHHLALGIRYDI